MDRGAWRAAVHGVAKKPDVTTNVLFGLEQAAGSDICTLVFLYSTQTFEILLDCLDLGERGVNNTARQGKAHNRLLRKMKRVKALQFCGQACELND